jgi:hypothetical protein
MWPGSSLLRTLWRAESTSVAFLYGVVERMAYQADAETSPVQSTEISEMTYDVFCLHWLRA